MVWQGEGIGGGVEVEYYKTCRSWVDFDSQKLGSWNQIQSWGWFKADIDGIGSATCQVKKTLSHVKEEFWNSQSFI